MMKREDIFPKRSLGQHFLEDKEILEGMAYKLQQCHHVVEIGPGKGGLTDFLLQRKFPYFDVVEVDGRCVTFLRERYKGVRMGIIEGDFLQLQLGELLPHPLTLVGNLPYNISSQILFKVLENRDCVVEGLFMLQDEVARRITAQPPSRVGGILTILLGAYYDLSYVRGVAAALFNPPPKVHSAVVHLVRKRVSLPCNESIFFRVVKVAFQQRRKKLRNALKGLGETFAAAPAGFLDRRAEELSVEDFILLSEAFSPL